MRFNGWTAAFWVVALAAACVLVGRLDAVLLNKVGKNAFLGDPALLFLTRLANVFIFEAVNVYFYKIIFSEV